MNDNKHEMALNQPDDSIENNRGEIVLYQPDSSIQLEVRVENETVWLTQVQMAELFQTSVPNINMHLKNIYEEGELEENATVKDFLIVRQEGKRRVQRTVSFYNLDMIISVGYRIKSRPATLFRIWATKTLKEYILRGYAVNQRFERIEQRVTATEKKIDFFVKTALPPKEGIFYDGQIFDAYAFVSDLIKSAKTSIILIDNYVDESVLMLLSKRITGVEASIYTAPVSPQLQLDLQRHNAQYPAVTIQFFTRSHDRFLIIDGEVYHIGASLKDLGRKWFAFSRMELDATALLHHII
jgi:hypothetical protein